MRPVATTAPAMTAPAMTRRLVRLESSCMYFSVPTRSHAVTTAVERTLTRTGDIRYSSGVESGGEPRGPGDPRQSVDLAQPSRVHVVHGAADVPGEQVGALLDQSHRLADVVLDVGERPGRPGRPAPGRLLDQVGEAHVVGRLQPAVGVV